MSHHTDSSPRSPLIRLQHPWIDPVLADLYDAFPFDADVAFYNALAAGHGTDVLELACGSGRLMLPLAKAGNTVVGVDASPHMLSLAEKKLRTAGQDVWRRCDLVQADICALDLGKEFDVAVIAARSFAHLTDRAAQQQALSRVRKHLRPRGILAMDLLNPSPSWLSQEPGTLRQDLVQETLDRVAMRTEAVISTDRAAQVRRIRSTYDLVDADGRVTRRIVEWPFRFTYRFEAELLLESAGFDVQAVKGGYDGEKFTSTSQRMVIIASVPDAHAPS
jgi:ubiquinone/menaquinone biosynthesis C-methylase UbiE